MGYYFYYKAENKVFTACFAEFLKRDFLLQEISGSNIDLEEVQELQSNIPSENTSLPHAETEHTVGEPERVAPIIRRSGRTPHQQCAQFQRVAN